jgi:AmmeMemoRadiSam system protein B
MALEKELERILASSPSSAEPEGNIKGLIAPHIDLAVGSKVYAVVYKMLRYTSPSKVIILGVGHQLASHLFCITDKTFESPLGNIETEKDWINELRKAGCEAIADNDFTHRSEHSIEFQLLFLRHMLREKIFTIVPILCGFPRECLEEYNRSAYLDRAGGFLEALSRMIREDEVILVAGVDLSHIGPKFGHEMPASHMKAESQRHDQNLLEALIQLNAEQFWQESRRVKDYYNVCGFSALACLIETLPPSHGKILDYQIWDEDLTQSAVSFASAVFTTHYQPP